MDLAKQHETMIHFAWETAKPIFITGISFAYAIFHNNVFIFLQQLLPPAERFPGFEVAIYFVVKTTGALSALFGLAFIVYRLWIFHHNKKI